MEYSQIIGRQILVHCATREILDRNINRRVGGFKEEGVFVKGDTLTGFLN